MRTVVSLPDPLLEAADEFAKRLGLTRGELYVSGPVGTRRSSREIKR